MGRSLAPAAAAVQPAGSEVRRGSPSSFPHARRRRTSGGCFRRKAAPIDHRHAIAYFVLLLIVLGLGAAVWVATRDWRAKRRASLRYGRQQAERRADSRAEREG